MAWILKLFHDLLEAHGYATLQTKDGMEALKLARQHHPDLILMDIQLPEVSGLEVATDARRRRSKGHPDHRCDRIRDERGRGEDPRGRLLEAYIAKPISVANFLQTVERFLS